MALQYKVIANQSNLSRQEWLEKRSNYLGGSDAAAAVGLNPWKSPFQVWLEKRSTTHDIPPQEDSLKLWYGRAAEDMIAKRFEMETGKKTRRNNSLCGFLQKAV
ncbi:YqaJ viral recombinase family protein [Peptoniphilaceae bacterium SGI.097]